MKNSVARILLLLAFVPFGSAAIARPSAGQDRQLRTLCSENGWLQQNFICTKIMTRVKAVFCSVMSIKACENENSALLNTLDDGNVGPPYWVIDDAGMNITVFLNMTGFSATSESATVLAPTAPTERDPLGKPDVPTVDHEVSTTPRNPTMPGSHQNPVVPTADHEEITTPRNPTMPIDHNPVVPMADPKPHNLTSDRSPETPTYTTPTYNAEASTAAPNTQLSTSYPELPTTDRHSQVTMKTRDQTNSATDQRLTWTALNQDASTRTTVYITDINTDENSVQSPKAAHIRGPKPLMDHSTSQRIAEVVSNAIATEIAKKLKIKIAEKLQSQ